MPTLSWSKLNGRVRAAAASADRKVLILLSVILLASLLVRLHGLDSQSLDCEELFTVPAATGHHYVYLRSQTALRFDSFPLTRQSYTERLTPDPHKGLAAITEVLSRNVHLPFYFYLMHFWLELAGTSEWALRFPSLLFSVLSVLMIFLLGRDLANSSVGLISATLVAFLPEQVYFAQEARMYTLLLLLTISSTYALVLAEKRPSAIWLHVLYAVLSIVGLYTHYIYLFCFAFQTLYIWIESISEGLGKPPMRWLIVQGCVVSALMPWLFVALQQKQSAPKNIFWARATFSFEFILRAILSKITRWIAIPEVRLGWLNVAVAYMLLALGVVSARANRKLFLLFGIWICLPIAAITAADLFLGTRAIGVPRYWITITPALYLLMALGLEKLWRLPELQKRGLRLALTCALAIFLCSASIWTACGMIRRKPDEYRNLAQVIDHQMNSNGNDLIFTEGTNAIPLAIGYYSRRNLRVLSAEWVEDKLREQKVDEILGGANVWLLVAGESSVKPLLEDHGYQLVDPSTTFGHITLYSFSAPPKKFKTDAKKRDNFWRHACSYLSCLLC